MKKQQKWIRIVAITLAALLVLGIVVSAISSTHAEETTVCNEYSFTIEYLEGEQALRISQRIVYTNESDGYLDRVLFYAPANMFRREDALMYESETLSAVFPNGYVPGGIDILSVSVNGKTADYGFQDTDEIYMRVECDLTSGESCTFEFEYYLLMSDNLSFLGIGESDWRMSDFYFIPAALDPYSDEFILNIPLSFTRYIHTDAANFSVDIALPESCKLVATGTETIQSTENGVSQWHIVAENVHDFAFVITKNVNEITATANGGTEVRIVSGLKDKAANRVLQYAIQAIECCEKWFGDFPMDSFDLVQTEYGVSSLAHSGCIWLGKDLLKGDETELAHEIYVAVAQQYFGRTAYALPCSDAWLSDSISEYIAYLILEENEGHDAYLKRLNEEIVDSLQLTIPGGLRITSDASLFTEYEYEIVVINRGAAVFHELRTAMGLEPLLDGLSLFYQNGLQTDILSEMDLVNALDEASGKSWEAFLTDWLFNIGDYVDQDIFWLD